MTRTELSHTTVAAVTRHLRRLGHRVERPDHRAAELLIDGQTTLHVFAASWYLRRHRVVVDGKTYHYRYRTRAWNIGHTHGNPRPAADYIALCTVGEPIASAFMVPGHVLDGRLVYELVGEGTHRRAVVAGYRGAWSLIRHRQRRRAA